MKLYRIFINGKETGGVKNGDSFEFDTEDGPQEIECKVNWCFSNKYVVGIKEAQTVYLKVASGMKFFLPIYILMLLAILTRWVHSLDSIPNIHHVQQIFVIIAFLYFGYYVTFGRRKYLTLQADASNPFA